MVETQKVRIGFVGTGSMGQCAHLRNYGTVPGCEVVALAELRPQLAQRVAAKYSVPRVYPDHEAMLANETLDGIVASHYFGRHGVLVPELLKAGVPVFTEKPLAGSIEAGQSILNALVQSGTWHMVGYHKRSDPATMFAKKEIDRLKQTGELGALKYVRLLMPAGDWIASGFTDLIDTGEALPEMNYEVPAPDMDKATFEEYTRFVNYYIHQVNLMRHLLGEPYRVTFADSSGVLLTVESASGVTGIIEMSPYITTVDWQEEALVAFEHGYVKIQLPAPLAANRPGRVEIFRDPAHGTTPETIIPTLPWVHAMRQQAMNFVAAIRGEIKPLCEASEAMEDLKVAREYIRMRFGK
ncbi:MAG TPA: Gfo/Idh/MocA family oxidoreductase [Candidatus Hydrogenedentes bacterium]|nr:Gfo/Idh/MocA family oxidoreductase [Candidatus Hydrogenedentota bacterium]